MTFEIIRNDITRVRADAIVNTANPNPCFGGGTDAAIYRAAGEKALLAERMKIGVIERGEVAVTAAFRLHAKYIIHTVGPAWTDGEHGEFDTLRSCYEKSLELAKALKCKSIAFPLIATGVYGFPKDQALAIATNVFEEFLEQNEMKIILVVFDKKSFELSGELFEHIQTYVDQNYVEEAHRKEFTLGSRRNLKAEEAEQMYCYRALQEDDEKLEMDAPCMEECVVEEFLPTASKLQAPKSAKPRTSYRTSSVDINKMLAQTDKTFQERLFEIIDERGLTGPQVYKNYISKQVFSKIQSNRNYHPNKYTALALCLSLHLNLEETQDLIGRAGWTLSNSRRADVVVKACIINHEYNVVKINIYLFEHNCAGLDKI